MSDHERSHIGVVLPNHGAATDPEALRQSVRAAEEKGFDSAWVTDHVAVPDAHAATYGTITEALVTLGYCAGATRRIRLGVSALVVPQRNPVLMWKQLASLSFLAQGRVICAVAAGWLEEEFRVLGGDFAHRGRRLESWLRFVRAVEPQMPGPVSYRGDIPVDGLWLSPAPAGGALELWSAGSSAPALHRAARLGTWHPVGASVAAIRRGAQRLRASNPDARIMNRINVSFRAEPDPDGTDERGHAALSGPPEWIADRLGRYAEAGCDGFVIMLDTTRPGIDERITRFAEEVLPLL